MLRPATALPRACFPKDVRGKMKFTCSAVAATETPTLAAAKIKKLGDSDLMVSGKYRSRLLTPDL